MKSHLVKHPIQSIIGALIYSISACNTSSPKSHYFKLVSQNTSKYYTNLEKKIYDTNHARDTNFGLG